MKWERKKNWKMKKMTKKNWKKKSGNTFFKHIEKKWDFLLWQKT